MAEDKTLTMDDVEKMDDVEYATVQFKSGKSFRIGSITGEEYIQWTNGNREEAELAKTTGEKGRTAGARLICQSLVDDAGKRILLDAEGKLIPQHVALWKKKPHKYTERLLKAIVTLNEISFDAKNG